MIYRLYFNRVEDWPQIWSIDEGSPETEVNVIGFRFEGGLQVTSGSDPTGSVRAWIAVEASGISIEGGVAVFEV